MRVESIDFRAILQVVFVCLIFNYSLPHCYYQSEKLLQQVENWWFCWLFVLVWMLFPWYMRVGKLSFGKRSSTKPIRCEKGLYEKGSLRKRFAWYWSKWILIKGAKLGYLAKWFVGPTTFVLDPDTRFSSDCETFVFFGSSWQKHSKMAFSKQCPGLWDESFSVGNRNEPFFNESFSWRTFRGPTFFAQNRQRTNSVRIFFVSLV